MTEEGGDVIIFCIYEVVMQFSGRDILQGGWSKSTPSMCPRLGNQ